MKYFANNKGILFKSDGNKLWVYADGLERKVWQYIGEYNDYVDDKRANVVCLSNEDAFARIMELDSFI